MRRPLLLLAVVIGLVAASAVAIALRPAVLGLDLQGGVEVVLQGQPTEDAQVTPEAIDRSVEIIRSRVDAFGVAEPEIQTQGDGQIGERDGDVTRDDPFAQRCQVDPSGRLPDPQGQRLAQRNTSRSLGGSCPARRGRRSVGGNPTRELGHDPRSVGTHIPRSQEARAMFATGARRVLR